MNFNEHLKFEGKHAILGASNYHWLNYDDDQLVEKLKRRWAPTVGTLLHQFAAEEHIRVGDPLRRSDWPHVENYLVNEGIPRFAIDKSLYFDTLYKYINDCIKYKMTPEVMLAYSEYLFGTADAISYNGRYLRIFDLKTGQGKPSIKQLHIYTALFCLEYNIDPRKIEIIDLRIYYKGDRIKERPSKKDILNVMSIALKHNNKIHEMESMA